MRAQDHAMGSCPFPEECVNVWDVKIEMESMIGDVSWGVGYRSEKFGLISVDDSYIRTYLNKFSDVQSPGNENSQIRCFPCL